jgi:alpha-L-fucosidase
MDLNAAKYPAEALFYTDIKSYEQGAGQHIAKENNQLPALSCLPINDAWFWKSSFPTKPVKDPAVLVRDNLVPFNQAYCTFLLNVAPNREGRIDDNALTALKQIGDVWKPDADQPKLPPFDAPIISHNLAKHQSANATWSDDMWIMDFGNDDNFRTAWKSNPSVTKPMYEVLLSNKKTSAETSFNLITILEPTATITDYRLEYLSGKTWKPIPMTSRANPGRAKIHRFATVTGSRVRVLIDSFTAPPAIAELGVYKETGR